jgi:hypothetical protein
MWRYRRVDIWILIGVASLFARLWTYHRLYDDLLAFPAAIALYRLATRDRDTFAAIAFVLMVGSLVAPSNRINYGGGWGDLSRIGEQSAWIAGMVFLMWRARRPNAIESESPTTTMPIEMT